MSTKRFTYEGDEWEATYDGFGVGVATGFEPKVDQFSFTFRCLSDPKRGEVRGHLRDSDPSSLSNAELADGLKKALTRTKPR